LPIGPGLSITDRAQRGPDLLLERRPRVCERDIETAALAFEVLRELQAQRIEPGIGADLDGTAEPLGCTGELRVQSIRIEELKQTNGVFVRRGEQAPDG